MADSRMTSEEAAAMRDFDQVMIDATTEDDIRGYMIEDGDDPERAFRVLDHHSSWISFR